MALCAAGSWSAQWSINASKEDPEDGAQLLSYRVLTAVHLRGEGVRAIAVSI